LIHASRSAGGIPTIQYEPFDIEGNLSGRKIDASPSAGRAPRSGRGLIPATASLLETVILPTIVFQRTTVGAWANAEADSARASVKQ